MNSEEIIQHVSSLVEEQCKLETNIFGYEIWTYHIAIVVEYAKVLADIFGADKEIVELSALLHDYAGIKDKSMYEKHHMYGAIEAEKLLRKLNYPEDKINKVEELSYSIEEVSP